MKKALAAMLGMFLLTIWPGGAIWQFMSKIIVVVFQRHFFTRYMAE